MADWIDCETDWAYWINPETFRMPRVKERVPVGVVVLIKDREDVDGRMVVVTRYCQAAADGLHDLDGKKEANAKLLDQMLEYMRKTNTWPVGTELKKTYKNGNVDLAYAPGDYDTFTLRLTPDLAGEDPNDFLGKLGPAVVQVGGGDSGGGGGSDEPWKIEPAKSSRAACRACKEKIAKGELRLGEPSEYEGNVSYRWYHLACAAGAGDAESLDGFDDLDEDQKQQVRSALEF